MPKKYLRKKTEQVKFMLWLPWELYKKVKVEAVWKDKTMTELIIEALQKYLEKKEEKP